jgi:hypothetical protein
MTSTKRNAEWVTLYTISMLPLLFKLVLVVSFVVGLFRPEPYTVRQLLINVVIYAIAWSAVGDIPWLYVRIRFLLHYTNKLTAPWWKEKPESRIVISK